MTMKTIVDVVQFERDRYVQCVTTSTVQKNDNITIYKYLHTYTHSEYND